MDFIPGLDLSERFFHQAVQPILRSRFPELRYGAARLGQGSDVLGFDTPRSMDHGWGPQLGLFLAEEDFATDLPEKLRGVLAEELPFEVEGFSTHFELHEDGSPHMARTRQRPIAHRVAMLTARRLFNREVGVDPLDHTLSAIDWLTMAEQRLRTIRSRACSAMTSVSSNAPEPCCTGIRMTCGCICWRRSGGASARRRPSLDGARKSATSSDRVSSPRGWSAS